MTCVRCGTARHTPAGVCPRCGYDGIPVADGCEAVKNRPEGDTRLSIILPDPGKEFRSLFYVVGCAAGPAYLDIIIEGEVARTYRFDVEEP